MTRKTTTLTLVALALIAPTTATAAGMTAAPTSAVAVHTFPPKDRWHPFREWCSTHRCSTLPGATGTMNPARFK